MPERAFHSSVQGRRDSNQDEAAVFSTTVAGAPARLLAVADGMGGMKAGERAARAAFEVVEAAATSGFPSEAPSELRDTLQRLVQHANQRVWQVGETLDMAGDIGTTLVVALLYGKGLLAAHAGDSRCYLVTGTETRQVTRDHTQAEELVDRGLLTAEQALASPLRNKLVNALGEPRDIRVDLFPEREGVSRPNHFIILLSSDGLHGSVEPADILQELRRTETIAQGCRNLISLALERGSKDNISLAAMEVGQFPRAPPWLKDRRRPDQILRDQRGPKGQPLSGQVAPSANSEAKPLRGKRVALSAAAIVLGGALLGLIGRLFPPRGGATEAPSPSPGNDVLLSSGNPSAPGRGPAEAVRPTSGVPTTTSTVPAPGSHFSGLAKPTPSATPSLGGGGRPQPTTAGASLPGPVGPAAPSPKPKAPRPPPSPSQPPAAVRSTAGGAMRPDKPGYDIGKSPPSSSAAVLSPSSPTSPASPASLMAEDSSGSAREPRVPLVSAPSRESLPVSAAAATSSPSTVDSAPVCQREAAERLLKVGRDLTWNTEECAFVLSKSAMKTLEKDGNPQFSFEAAGVCQASAGGGPCSTPYPRRKAAAVWVMEFPHSKGPAGPQVCAFRLSCDGKTARIKITRLVGPEP